MTTPSKPNTERVERHLQRARGAGIRSLTTSFGFSFALPLAPVRLSPKTASPPLQSPPLRPSKRRRRIDATKQESTPELDVEAIEHRIIIRKRGRPKKSREEVVSASALPAKMEYQAGHYPFNERTTAETHSSARTRQHAELREEVEAQSRCRGGRRDEATTPQRGETPVAVHRDSAPRTRMPLAETQVNAPIPASPQKSREWPKTVSSQAIHQSGAEFRNADTKRQTATSVKLRTRTKVPVPADAAAVENDAAWCLNVPRAAQVAKSEGKSAAKRPSRATVDSAKENYALPIPSTESAEHPESDYNGNEDVEWLFANVEKKTSSLVHPGPGAMREIRSSKTKSTIHDMDLDELLSSVATFATASKTQSVKPSTAAAARRR